VGGGGPGTPNIKRRSQLFGSYGQQEGTFVGKRNRIVGIALLKHNNPDVHGRKLGQANTNNPKLTLKADVIVSILGRIGGSVIK